jgi:hypothetical protein
MVRMLNENRENPSEEVVTEATEKLPILLL